MKQTMIILGAMFMVCALQAQTNKNFKQIEKELTALKGTEDKSKFIELLKVMSETQPRTEEDITVLARLMDTFQDAGQKALLKTQDPKLAKVIIKECKERIDKCHKYEKIPEEEYEKQTIAEKHKKTIICMNAAILMGELGKLTDKEAVPFLKQYIIPHELGEDEGVDGTLSYVASNILKEIDLGISLEELAKELNSSDLTAERKEELINQIEINKDPGKKKVLKDLVSKHSDEKVRVRCRSILSQLISKNPEDDDLDFIYQGLPKCVSYEYFVTWPLIALKTYSSKNKKLDSKFLPILEEIVTKGEASNNRIDAAEVLGAFKIKGSMPYLEECSLKDEKDFVRDACKRAIKQISEASPN